MNQTRLKPNRVPMIPGPVRHQIYRFCGWALAAYWSALFLATHVPIPKGTLPDNSDKVAHFVAYAGLAFLLGLWIRARTRLPVGSRLGLRIFAIAAVFGAIDEILQGPVGRHPDLLDWIADCAGAVGGIMTLFFCLRVFSPSATSAPRVDDLQTADVSD